VFSSGLGATTTVLHHIVSIDDVYGGTNRYFNKVLSKFGVDLTFCDMTKPENLKSCLKPNTKVTLI